jgi:hypothetical protein
VQEKEGWYPASYTLKEPALKGNIHNCFAARAGGRAVCRDAAQGRRCAGMLCRGGAVRAHTLRAGSIVADSRSERMVAPYDSTPANTSGGHSLTLWPYVGHVLFWSISRMLFSCHESVARQAIVCVGERGK